MGTDEAEFPRELSQEGSVPTLFYLKISSRFCISSYTIQTEKEERKHRECTSFGRFRVAHLNQKEIFLLWFSSTQAAICRLLFLPSLAGLHGVGVGRKEDSPVCESLSFNSCLHN
jgi:hypothetical protein